MKLLIVRLSLALSLLVLSGCASLENNALTSLGTARETAGEDVISYTDGARYTGSVLYRGSDTLPHGYGIYIGRDRVYEGWFLYGRLDGQGTMTYANGYQYVGEWKNGQQHGQGTYTAGPGEFEGDQYVGEWKDSKYHGQGTYIYADGSQYVGEWKDGLFNGQGTFTDPDGYKYVGEFKDDLYHGQGTLTYSDGYKFVGEFKDDEPWEGTEYDPDGYVTGVYSGGIWKAN